jgi:hypothetical protein
VEAGSGPDPRAGGVPPQAERRGADHAGHPPPGDLAGQRAPAAQRWACRSIDTDASDVAPEQLAADRAVVREPAAGGRVHASPARTSRISAFLESWRSSARLGRARAGRRAGAGARGAVRRAARGRPARRRPAGCGRRAHRPPPVRRAPGAPPGERAGAGHDALGARGARAPAARRRSGRLRGALARPPGDADRHAGAGLCRRAPDRGLQPGAGLAARAAAAAGRPHLDGLRHRRRGRCAGRDRRHEAIAFGAGRAALPSSRTPRCRADPPSRVARPRAGAASTSRSELSV